MALMRFDPSWGHKNPYPCTVHAWRACRPGLHWHFNPWTGKHRDARDVKSDPFGLLIVPPGEELVPAAAGEMS